MHRSKEKHQTAPRTLLNTTCYLYHQPTSPNLRGIQLTTHASALELKKIECRGILLLLVGSLHGRKFTCGKPFSQRFVSIVLLFHSPTHTHMTGKASESIFMYTFEKHMTIQVHFNNYEESSHKSSTNQQTLPKKTNTLPTHHDCSKHPEQP